MRSALEKDLPLDCLALSVAGWMRYVTGTDEDGEAIDVSDPLAAKLHEVGRAGAGDVDGLVDGYLGMEDVFGRDLGQAPTFRAALSTALAALYDKGTLRTVTHYAQR